MTVNALNVTGHRKITPYGYEGRRWWNPAIDPVVQQHHTAIMHELSTICINAINVGYNTFISGGAIGADQLFAEVIIYLKQQYPIRLIIARPFPSQHIKWHPDGQERFFNILRQADEVIDVHPDPYAPWKMMERNKWMVDRSLGTIAIWNGTHRGGTWNCVDYATSKGREIIHLDAITLKTLKLQ